MSDRIDIEFPGEDGTTLRGWLYLPAGAGAGPRPAITLAHGFAAVKEHGLDRFASAFAEAHCAAGFEGQGPARCSRLSGSGHFNH